MTFTLKTRECAQKLRTSEKTLRRLRLDGYLRPGIHYRAIGTGRVRPALLWDPEATEAALAKRSKALSI
jgi:hypothetical protein